VCHLAGLLNQSIDKSAVSGFEASGFDRT
jgi:hypothetical protein